MKNLLSVVYIQPYGTNICFYFNTFTLMFQCLLFSDTFLYIIFMKTTGDKIIGTANNYCKQNEIGSVRAIAKGTR